MNQKNIRIHEELNLNYIIKLISNNWLYFGLSVVLALLIALLVNKISKPIYKVNSMVVINEDGNNTSSVTANIMQEIGFASSTVNFINEVSILQSTPIVRDAINNLDFQISYYEHSHFNSTELYKSTPFVVIVNKERPQSVDVPFYVTFRNNGTFELSISEKNVKLFSFISNQITGEELKLKYSEIGDLNTNVNHEAFSFKIILNDQFDNASLQNRRYSFIIHNPKNLIKQYQKRLKVEQSDIESTIASLSFDSESSEKGIDFLNSLTNAYIENDKARKNFIAEKTIEYIDLQLNDVADSLRVAENNLQQFRSGNRIMDVSTQSTQILDELSRLDMQKSELELNGKYYDYIEEYFQENQEYVDLIAPTGMGIEDPLINSSIQELISLNAEKVTLVENDQELSPYLRRINIRIENLKNIILENIDYAQKTNEISINEVESRIAQLNNEISKMPETERRLLGMQRAFNLNDQIYTYLLEKRAEAHIAKASYQADAEILEPADSEGIVQPKSKRNYLVAIIFGFILPISLFRIRDITRKKFSDKEEIMRIIDLPVAGQIYRNNKNVETVVTSFPKSHITESFRRMRSSLGYFIPEEKCNVIAITSTISNEGKSFTALNMALSLVILGKKTILIHFDLRKPKLYNRLDLKETKGLSAFLSKQAKLSDIVQKTNVEKLDVIWAGELPPNSGELIASPLTEVMIADLKQAYDYIIIDTAPIGILADAAPILKLADLNIFVVRINHSLIKESVQTVQDLKDQEIKNLALVINGIPVTRKTRYGYGYYDLEKEEAKK